MKKRLFVSTFIALIAVVSVAVVAACAPVVADTALNSENLVLSNEPVLDFRGGPSSEEVIFTDEVVKLAADTFIIEDEQTIRSMADFAAGAILVVPDGEETYAAYKVISSISDGGDYILTVAEPLQEEVYASINVCGSYTIADGTLVLNEEVLAAQLETQMAIGDYIPSVSFPRVDFDLDAGLVYLDIQLGYSDFLPDVDSSISLLLQNVIEIAPYVNFKTAPFTFSIGADMAISTNTTVGFSVGSGYAYQEDMEAVVAQLAEITKTTISESFLNVFSWTYPIGATGLMIGYDLDLVLDIKFGGELNAVANSYAEYTLGIYYVDGELNTISQKGESSFDFDRVELIGNLDVSTGLLNTLSLSILQIAKVSIMLEGGVYADIYGALEVDVFDIEETTAGWYLDAGLYYDLSIGAGIDLFGLIDINETFSLLGDRYSLIELGSRTLVMDYNDVDGVIDTVNLTSASYVLPDLEIKQFDLVSREISFVEVGYEKSSFGTNPYFTVTDGILTLTSEAPDGFNTTLGVSYKANTNLTAIINIVKDATIPYVTSSAILDFDKTAPANLLFNINMLEATIVSIDATDITATDYTVNAGTITINQGYLIRRANGELEISVTTSENVIKLWINISGTVSITTAGSGTEVSPYEIFTVEQFKALASDPSQYNGLYFALTDDIDFRGESMAPIANFYGFLDGQGYELYDFNISTAINGNAGLFAINSGTITDLKVDGVVSIKNNNDVNVGVIAGVNNGSIIQCETDGTASAEASGFWKTTTLYVGGVAGINTGTIVDCASYSTVSLSSQSYSLLSGLYLAGIAGDNDGGTVVGCVNNGILDNSSSLIDGIVVNSDEIAN